MSSESRAEYYKKAFEKLENEGKHTWNWAAFFFTVWWMQYRKMYLYSVCTMVAFLGICAILGCLWGILGLFTDMPEDMADTAIMGIVLIIYIMFALVYGRYGNSWYRKAIENKILRGYHNMKHFCPTSVASAILEGGMFFVMFGDWLKKKCEHVDKKLMLEDKMPTKENIELYLNPKKKEGIFMNVIVLIAIMFQLLIMLIGRANFKEKINQIKLQEVAQQIEQE